MKPEEKTFDESPILIPKNSFVEGYIKSHKAIRIECNFNGTIFTNNRVIIDGSSKITGDIICSDLILTGTVSGNIFCIGRVTLNKGAQVNGKIYTSMFTNEQETNLHCVIQISNQETISKANELLEKLNMESGLSVDPLLTQFRELFYSNAFARKANPDTAIIHKFTEQHDLERMKVTLTSAPANQPSEQEFNNQS